MEKSQLKSLNLIATGMSGSVYITSTQVPVHQGELVYKEYNQHPDHAQWIADARHAIAWRDSLPTSDRQNLDTFAAWPIAMVTDGARPVGCLIPRIPQRFFMDERQPDGSSKRVPRALEKVTGTPRQWAVLGMDVEAGSWTPELRLALAAHLVFAVTFLHKRGLVYGDISLKNAVFDSQNPAVMLLDCDGVASAKDPNRRQANSPRFLAPECSPPGTNPFSRGRATFQDQATDVYKFGQLLIKTLVPGAGAAQAQGLLRIQAHVSPTIYQAVARSQSLDPTQRGSAEDLYDAIFDEVSRLVLPPRITSFTHDVTTLPRGTDVELTWEVTGATGLRLDGPNEFSIILPSRSTRWTITPPVSGRYGLVATNRFGASRADRDLQVFDMPAINLDLKGLSTLFPTNLPQVSTPEIQIPSVAPLTTALVTAMPDPPAVRTPSVEGLFTLSALTQTLVAVTATEAPRIPTLDGRLTDTTELPIAKLLSDLGTQLSVLGDVLTQARHGVERAASTAADEAARRVAAQLLNQPPGQTPPGRSTTP